MFRIKICGVTEPRDAVLAVEAGADAVGINFYRGSPRFVAPADASAIAGAVAGRALVVGVFVNEDPDVILAVCREAGLAAVQLSGDEPAADAAKITLPRIKAVRPRPGGGLDSIGDYPCEAFLVDAGGPGQYGGTGRTLEWGALDPANRQAGNAAGRSLLHGRPWILAGGLTPDNVAAAIRAARPAGVDTASGVEYAPGKKDPGKVRKFIMNAREGFGLAAS